MRILFRDARLIDPADGLDATGQLLVEGGTVLERGPAVPADATADQVIECAGHALAPGLIDMRAQLREPGEEHKENLQSAAEAAVAGGVTTVCCLPGTEPPIEDPSLAAFITRRSAELGLARIRAWGALTKRCEGRQLTEMGLLTEVGAVGFTDAPAVVADAAVLRRALAYANGFGQVVHVHPEEPSLAAGGVATEGEIATRLGLPGIPAAAELIQVERDLRLAELTGGRLHIGPLSTAAAIEAVRRAKRQGLRVTADTAPHYFALNETAIGDYRTFAKVSPPLRGEYDRRAVVEAVADGTIDAIASDHAPHDEDSKRVPYVQAEFGIIGLETLLLLGLELVHNRRLSLVALFRRVSLAPATILKLPGGSLQPGAPADLVLFDPDKPGKIDVASFRSKSKNSPFHNRPIQGRVLGTWVAGRRAFA